MIQDTGLGDDFLEQLLRQAGRSAPAATDVEARDYDWNTPCRFVAGELARLNDFAAQAAERMSGGLGKLLRSQSQVTVTAVRQQFARDLAQAAPEMAAWKLYLLHGDARPGGLLGVPQVSAGGWISRLLGGPLPQPGQEKKLSPLESALLVDVMTTLAGAFCQAVKDIGGPAMSHASQIPEGQGGLWDEEAREYCRFVFHPEGAGENETFCFVVLSDLLEGLAGGGAAGGAAAGGAARNREQIRKDLLGHLERAPVVAQADLGNAHVSLRDILSLEEGDVLVLQRKITDSIEVRVQGQIILRGFPAMSDGHYAVQVAPPLLPDA